MLYCNFRSLGFLGLLGFLIRQLKIKFMATLLSAAKIGSVGGRGFIVGGLVARAASYRGGRERLWGSQFFSFTLNPKP